MKPTTIITTIAALCVLGTLVNSAPPPEPQTYRHDVVLLQGRQCTLVLNTGDPTGCGNGFRFDGIEVYNSSSSSNAPTFPFETHWNCPPPGHEVLPRITMAQAIADLMDQGYSMQDLEGGSTYLMVRKVRK